MGQIQKNAREVAGLLGSDWRIAYVIACSVKEGAGQGSKKLLQNSAEVGEKKVSLFDFALLIKEQAKGRVYGLGRMGIKARLDRWNELYDKGVVPWHSDDLTPADANDEVEWPDMEFQRQDGGVGDKGKSKVADVKQNATAVAEAMSDPAFVEKVTARMDVKTKRDLAVQVVDEQVLDAPVTRQKIRNALNEFSEINEQVVEETRGRHAINDVISSAASIQGNKHGFAALQALRSWSAEIESGGYRPLKIDSVRLEEIQELVAWISTEVAFMKVSR